MQPENIEDVYPLSPLQQGLLFHTLEAPGSGVYVVQVSCGLRGKLDADAFEHAWRRTVERHPALRTAFVWEGLEEPMQVVCRNVELPFLQQDWRGLSPAAQEEQAEECLRSDLRRGFAPNQAPLMRLSLFRLADDRHRLVWSHHHLLLDGWALSLVIREVFAHYRGLVCGREVRLPQPRPYRDYIAWLRRQDMGATESFWRRHLSGFIAPTALAPLAASPHGSRDQGAARMASLPAAATEVLRAWAKRARVTLNTLIQGAWALLLSRYSGERDIVFGVISSGRPSALAGVESMLGLFINTLPMRVRAAPRTRVASWMREIQSTQTGLLEFEHSSLRQVQAWSEVPRGVPLFETLVDFVSYPPEAALQEDDAPVDVEDLRFTERPSYPLALIASPGRELSLRLLYDPRRLDGAAVARLHEHLRGLLLGLAGNPEACLEDLTWLDPGERCQLLYEWNDTRSALPDGSLPALFETRVRTSPEAPAVLFGREVWTYGELNRRANRLAHHLRRLGVGPGSLVGVYLERSPEMVSCLLAVLKTGGAYVPLDIAYPPARVRWILSSLGIRSLLTQGAVLANRGGEALDGLPDLEHVLRVDRAGDGARLSDLSADDLEPLARAGDLAYIIFTSGSTGTPKGVMVHHAPVLNLIAWVNGAFGVSAADRVLFITSLCFDLSVYDIFGILAAGGSIRVAMEEEVRDPERLVQTLVEEPITFWDSAPAALQQLVPFFPRLEEASPLRLVFLSGDWIPVTLPDQVRRAFPVARVIALGGATEATVWSNSFPIGEVDSSWASIPYGRPIPNARYHALDDVLEPCPIGVAGDLHIGGDCLAAGYAGEPALTATKFLPDPFGGETGARLYRTGDRARFRMDGNLEFLGRLDHQVKIRGFRIELGEIEAVLAESSAVRDAVVAAREDGPGGKRLVAYVVPAGEPAPSVGELRSHLATRLPEYMIPAAFVLLPTLPLTANGKVDRRALPSPESSAPVREGYVEPRTAIEERLAAIWAEVLRTPSPGIHDNFFHLGGDSILSIQIVSRARQQGLSLSSAQIFERQTIAELAAVAIVAGTDATAGETSRAEPTVGPIPLTPVQRWFFGQEPADPHHFNLSLLLEARQSLQPAHLATAVGSLLHHHDALRLRFAQESGIWNQRVGEGGEPIPFSVIDLSNLAGSGLDAAVTAASAALQAHGLDLERGPLLRAALLRRGAQRTERLLLAVHHLVVDGVSWRILLEDLQTAYEQVARGKEVRLPGRTTSFSLWAEHLAALAADADLDAELPLWLSAVTGAPRLPVDFEGGVNTVDAAATVALGLSIAETRALLQEVPDIYRTRIDDVLSAALSDTFTTWTGTPDLLVDVESHGRQELPGLDLSRTVGWLTSIYPLRLAVSPGSPGVRLKVVKEALRAVPRLGIGFGLLRDRENAAGAELRRHAGAEVVFNYLGQLDQALPADSPFLLAPEPAGADRSPRQRRRYLLEIGIAVVNGCLHVTWTYGSRLHRRSTIEALAESFVSSLRALLAHCRSPEAGGRTPSDFPLCALDQPAVDRLAGDGRGVEDVYPLSPLQQGMLFHTLRSPGAGVYWQQLSWTMRGDLDATALEKAWQFAVDRHSILRTSLAWEDLDEPLQLVHRHVTLPLERLDWSALSPAERDRHFASLLQQDRETGFDLRLAPLMRLRLIAYGDGEHLLIWSHHHLLLDGWSLPIFYAEVFTAYEAFRSARVPRLERPRPFRDYIAWQRQQEPARAEAFWRQYLRGFAVPTPLSSATQGVSLPAGTPEYARAKVGLPVAATAALQSLARRHGLTLNTLVQGAWALLLSHYSADGDVMFGSVSAGRPTDLAGAESMLGAFLNTLPVRVRVSGREELLAWLHELQADQLTLREYEHTPLQLVQEWSEIPRGLPLFGSILIFENYPIGDFLRENAGSLKIAGVHFEERTNYPIALVAIPGRELSLRISYDRAAFDGLAAARTLGSLRVLLEAMPTGLGAAIESLPLLSAAERSQLVFDWNDTEVAYGEDACLHDLIAIQVERSPERTALACEDRQLTYRELQRRACHLARSLRSSGCGPETRVGVCMERSLEMMVALLGILEAGAAYVPIDPEYPEERLRFILEDSRVTVLLTQEHLRDRLPQGIPTLALYPEADATALSGGDAIPERALPDHPAYVIYTSGSTGRPKGAIVSHRAIGNRLLWMQDAYRLGEGDRVLQKTPFSFDVSVWELFWPLLAGARLVIAQPGGHRDPAYLLRVIPEQEITVIHFVPPMLQVFLEVRGLAAAGSLRLVVCSGEALGADLQERFFSCLGARLHNLYGPTEAAVDVTFWACGRDAGGSVPIGRPIANTSIHVLDPWMRPVPVGVQGELHIGGVNLARGYLGRPELTAEKFVPDPIGERPGRRLYRTGDLARHRSDGAVEFLGRLDHQVKIRGFRVELGEIEATLTDHPAVREAVVLSRGDRLVAYVVPAGEPAAAGELRRWLAGRLPEYMVPFSYVNLPALPLTGNGKIDRQRLPDPETRRSDEDVFVAPRTATEEDVARICTRLLGIERMSVLDDFFARGGDSLKAMRLASKLSRSFDVQIGLRTLYEKPTIAGLSELIERDQMARASRAEDGELSRLLAEIENMSDKEARLLAGFEEESMATERLDSEDNLR